MARKRRRSYESQSEPWHFSHVQQYPIANTFTQIQTSQVDTAPYEYEFISMYDPSVLQASTPQLMPYIRGLHYGVTPYLAPNLAVALETSTAVVVSGTQSRIDQSLTIFAALFDDAGEGTLLEVDQIGVADFHATFHEMYVTASSVENTFVYEEGSNDCDVTLQQGWLPSPTLTLAFLPTLGSAADATTLPAGLMCVQGFLEVEWRMVSPERLRQQALARVFEKGG